MSDVVDNRIVEMRFDNNDFEKNVAESMKTLKALKSSLDNLSDAADGFKSLSEAANKVDFSKLNANIDSIAHRMSTWGIASAKIITDFTSFAEKKLTGLAKKTIGQIESGGKKRASNIEKAKFQLKGLGVEWSQIEDDVNYGVQDTAYGLDSAARVASQLVASSVKIGTEMKTSLRGISGVAAMTQSSYDEIGHIFTTIAGQGKMMTMQLRQLEMRGLNVAAEIAKMSNSIIAGEKDVDEETKKLVENFTGGMKLTEKSVRDMVTDGKVNFKIFSKLMDEAFGAHAKDANRTFEGVLSNINSALSKIGALFYQPFIEDNSTLIVLLDRIRGDLNAFKSFIAPMVGGITEEILWAIYKVDQFYKSLREIGVWKALWDAFIYTAYALVEVLKPLKEGFQSVFEGLNLGELLLSLAEKLRDFTQQLLVTEGAAEGLRAIGKLLGVTLKVIGKTIAFIMRSLAPVINAIGAIVTFLLRIIGIFEPVVSILSRLLYEFLRFKVLRDVMSILKSFSLVLVDALKTVGKIVGITFIGTLAAAFKVLSSFVSMLSSFIKVIKDAVVYNAQLLKPLIDIVYQFVRFKLLKDVTEIVKSFISVIKTAFMIISGAVAKAFISAAQKIIDTITKLITKAKELATNFKNSFSDIHSFIGAFINPFVLAIDKLRGLFAPKRGGKSIFGTFVDDIREIVNLQTASIPEKIGQIAEKVKALANSFILFARTKFDTISSGFKTFIKNVGEVGLLKAVSEKFNSLKNSIANVSIYNNFKSIIDDLTSKSFPELISNLKQLISLKLQSFSNSLKNFGNSLKDFYSQLKQNEKLAPILEKIEGAVSKIKSKLEPVVPVIKSIGYAIAGIGLLAFQQFKNVLDNLSKISFDDIKKGITGISTSFTNIIEVIKKLPIIGSAISIVQKSVSLILGLFGKIGPYFKSLNTSFSKFISLFKGGSKDVEKSAKVVTRSLEAFDEDTDKAGPFSKLTAAIQFLKDRFNDLVNFIRTEFPGLNLQKFLVAAFAFTVAKSFINLANAITGTTKQIQEVAKELVEVEKAATGLFTGFKKIPESITTALDAFKSRLMKPQYSIGEQVKMFAISIAILAGSLYLLSTIPETDLERSIKYLGMLAAGVVGFATILAMISQIKLNDLMAQFSLSIFLMSASILVLVGALKFAVAIKESIEDIAKGIGVLAALSGLLIGIAALMSKFVPTLTSGALFFLSIGAAIWIFGKSLVGLIDLVGSDADKVNNALNYLVEVMISLSVFSLAVSKLTFASGLSILALVISIKLIGTALSSVATDSPDWNTIKENCDRYLIALSAIALLLVATRVAGKYAKSAGLGILAMAVAMRLIIYNIIVLTEYLHEAISGGKSQGLFASMVFLIAILAGFAGLIIASQKAGEHAKSAMKGIIFLALGMTLLLFSISHIIKSMHEYGDDAGAMMFMVMGLLVVVTVLAAVLIAATSLTKDAKVGPIIAIGLMLAELAVVLMLLSVIPSEDLLPATISLGLLMVALAYVFKQASKMTEGIKILPIIASLAALVIAVAALTWLKDENWLTLIAASGGLALVLVGLGKCMDLASKANWKGAGIMILGLIPLAAAAGALWLLAGYPWQQIAAAALALSGVIIVISKCLTSMMWVGMEGSKAAKAMLIVAPMLVALGFALGMIADNNWVQIITAAAAMSIVFAALVIAINILGNLGKQAAAGAGILLIATLPLIVVGAVLVKLSQIDWETTRKNIITMGWTFLALIAAIGIIGGLVMYSGVAGAAIIIGLAALAAVIVEFALAGLVFIAVANGLANAITSVANSLMYFSTISAEQLESIKNVIVGLGAAIGQGLATAIGEFVLTLLAYLEQIWNTVTSWFDGTVIPGAKELGGGVVAAVAAGILGGFGPVGVAIAGFAGFVVSKLKGSGIEKETRSVGEDFVNGYASGIEGKASGVYKTVDTLGKDSLESLRKAIDAHSASRATTSIGNDYGSGYGIGIAEMNEFAKQSGIDIANFSLDGIGSIVNSGLFESWGNTAAGKFLGSLSGKLAEWGIDVKGLFGQVKDAGADLFSSIFDSVGGGAHGGSGAKIPKTSEEIMAELRKGKHASSKEFRDNNSGEWWRNESKSLETGTDTDSGGGKGGGGGGSAAETKKSTEIMDYARKVVEKYSEAFGRLYETAGDTTGLEASKSAVTELAKAMYEAQGNVFDGTDEKLAEALEAFKTFSENMKKSMKDTLKSTEEFKESFGFKPKDLMKNMDSNKKALEKWWKYLELAAMKGFDKKYLLNIVNAGFSAESLNELRYMCSLHSDAVDEYKKRIEEADNDTEESFNTHMSRLLAIFENAADKFKSDNDFTLALKEKFTEWRTIIADYMLNYDEIVKKTEEGYKSTLQHFKKFTVSKEDRELDITKLIDYEKSQKKAQEMFTQHLTEIIDKGGSKELVDHIMDMGYEQGYAYAKSISDGTEEQIKELGDLFIANETTVPKENAEKLGMSYAGAYTEGFKGMLDEMGQYLNEVANGEHMGFIPEDLSNVMIEVAKAMFGDEETARSAIKYFSEGLDTMFNTLVSDKEAANMVSGYATQLASNFATGFNNDTTKTAITEGVTAVADTALEAFKTSLDMHEGTLEEIEQIGSIVPFSFENGIVKNITRPEDASKEMSEAVVEVTEKIIAFEKFRDIADNIIQGLVQGLRDGKDDVLGEIRDLSNEMGETMEEETEIESPSKVFVRYGRFIDLGLANGISANSGVAIDATKSLAERTVESFNTVIGMIDDILAENMDYTPSIVPVLDTSMIQNGVGYMNGLFGNEFSLGVGANYANAMSRIPSASEADESLNGNTGNTYNFTQNNYSPKALSRLDIYRQTRNQFTRMKGVVEAR